MSKLSFFLLICCVGVCVRSNQVLSVDNVRLTDHIPYYTRLMQETVNDLETRGWHYFQMIDWTETLDSNIYGWELQGNVTYKNGFVVGLESIHLVNPTTQFWSPALSSDNADRVFVYDSLSLNEVAIGYDVQLDLVNGKTHHFTGIYTHEYITFWTEVVKNLFTNEMTASVRLTGTSSSPSRRIQFLPANNIGEVIQRSFVARSSSGGAETWAPQIEAAMLEKANIIPFPDICYNCAA